MHYMYYMYERTIYIYICDISANGILFHRPGFPSKKRNLYTKQFKSTSLQKLPTYCFSVWQPEL